MKHLVDVDVGPRRLLTRLERRIEAASTLQVGFKELTEVGDKELTEVGDP